MTESSATRERSNPFRVISPLNAPLRAETCQRIHANALRHAATSSRTQDVFAGIDEQHLRERARLFGPQVYLAHPQEIERLFRGVTLAVYQAIESLYCSRLERSYRSVYRILRALALATDVLPIEEEAVWAMCMHLAERRAGRTAVTVERTPWSWLLIEVNGDQFSGVPEAALVMEVEGRRVMALRTGGPISGPELRALALYDAIVAERRPDARGAAGLVWRVPTCLQLAGPLTDEGQRACAAMGIVTEPIKGEPTPVAELRQRWAGEQARRPAPAGQWERAFESVLNRMYGTSPLREREEREHAFGSLTGYTQDPAEVFPALRALLPTRQAVIGQDATIAYDGLHYADALLAYWAGSRVALKRSEHAEAAAWVYLEEEILCQAMARELRRADGSYRPSRARR